LKVGFGLVRKMGLLIRPRRIDKVQEGCIRIDVDTVIAHSNEVYLVCKIMTLDQLVGNQRPPTSEMPLRK